jgi:hypothetical protein
MGDGMNFVKARIIVALALAFVNLVLFFIAKDQGRLDDQWFALFIMVVLLISAGANWAQGRRTTRVENHVDRWAKGCDLVRKPFESDDALRARCRVVMKG